MSAPEPDGSVQATGRPVPAARVEAALVVVCRRLGQPLPVGPPLIRAYVLPSLPTVCPGAEGAAWGRIGVAMLRVDSDALLEHELGHLVAWRAGVRDPQRSEAWARLAEHRPSARLAAWWRGGPA
jgi:hypothetical protein